MERALAINDRYRRLNIYREAEQVLMDDAGIIPLFHVKDYVPVHPHVRGIAVSPFGEPDVTGITLLTT